MDGYRGDGYMGERGRGIIKSQYVGKKVKKMHFDRVGIETQGIHA